MRVHVIRTEGADASRFVLDDDPYGLVLLLGNGLEGDVRFTGNTQAAVDAARGLIRGTGNCRPIDPPADSPLHHPGDECYQQGAARAFLDPVPTGELAQRVPERLDAAQCAWWSKSTDELREVEDRNQAWSFAGLEIPRSERLPAALDRAPTYRRGCLTYSLERDAHFLLVDFERPDGSPAVALVLRERWHDWFAGWVPEARRADAQALATLLDGEIAEAWRRTRPQ